MNWPASTPFFSSPERTAIAGIPLQTVHQSMVTGEEYLAYLRTVVEHYDLHPLLYHRVISARAQGAGGTGGRFQLTVEHRGTEKKFSCRNLIMAHGNMHAPRRLGVPGEDLEFVDNYHDDIHRYFRQNLLIVGGRNSAVEAAIRAWRGGARVTLMYRQPELTKEKLNSRYHLEISILMQKERIRFLGSSEIREIRNDEISYLRNGKEETGTWDFVLLCTGFEKDLSLLHELGVKLNPDGEPVLNEPTMEANVPGLYFAGTSVSGGRDSYRQFVGTSHVHVEKILRSIAGENARAVTGDYFPRSYPFSRADIEPVEGKSVDENTADR
ncbi:Thioredoxin reductase [Salinispira pacifica]|uniref:Thioredoxin reductase n=2 Tax=Salinispira pacifica TaxID=1307761 RepID=V5WED5_9SPIO|nr:NAD(P)-binding domain-containing protein [Salinispira pacifica]AHC14167.1 Thioredoxin reductase [Salinispira pacifica]